MKLYTCLGFIMYVAMYGSVTSAEEIAEASSLAFSCTACHGSAGVSRGPATPSIAGLSTDYFIATMQAYKKGDLPATIMTRIAKGYSAEEIKRLAGYFSTRQPVAARQAFDPDKARRGKKLHKKYCNKCHENAGGNAEDNAGFLAGQWSPYLQYTLQDFLSGHRDMEKKKKQQLDKLISQQGQDGIESLLHFYMSQ